MNDTQAKRPSWRFVIAGSLVAASVIGLFVLVPCTLREIGFRAVLGRDIAMWRQVDAAIRTYHLDHGTYPASLAAPDFQPYIDHHVTLFLQQGRLSYHPPLADSPPNFVLIEMTTSRGNYSVQLDGTPLYPNVK